MAAYAPVYLTPPFPGTHYTPGWREDTLSVDTLPRGATIEKCLGTLRDSNPVPLDSEPSTLTTTPTRPRILILINVLGFVGHFWVRVHKILLHEIKAYTINNLLPFKEFQNSLLLIVS